MIDKKDFFLNDQSLFDEERLCRKAKDFFIKQIENDKELKIGKFYILFYVIVLFLSLLINIRLFIIILISFVIFIIDYMLDEDFWVKINNEEETENKLDKYLKDYEQQLKLYEEAKTILLKVKNFKS